MRNTIAVVALLLSACAVSPGELRTGGEHRFVVEVPRDYQQVYVSIYDGMTNCYQNGPILVQNEMRPAVRKASVSLVLAGSLGTRTQVLADIQGVGDYLTRVTVYTPDDVGRSRNARERDIPAWARAGFAGKCEP